MQNVRAERITAPRHEALCVYSSFQMKCFYRNVGNHRAQFHCYAVKRIQMEVLTSVTHLIALGDIFKALRDLLNIIAILKDNIFGENSRVNA